MRTVFSYDMVAFCRLPLPLGVVVAVGFTPPLLASYLPCFVFYFFRSFFLPYALSYTVGFRQSKTAPFDWTFFRLESSGPSSYRQSSRFNGFCALPRGGWCEGVLLYGSRNRLAAVCFASNGSANPRPSELVALGLAESRQSFSRRSRCWQHGIDTAAAVV